MCLIKQYRVSCPDIFVRVDDALESTAERKGERGSSSKHLLYPANQDHSCPFLLLTFYFLLISTTFYLDRRTGTRWCQDAFGSQIFAKTSLPSTTCMSQSMPLHDFKGNEICSYFLSAIFVTMLLTWLFCHQNRHRTFDRSHSELIQGLRGT